MFKSVPATPLIPVYGNDFTRIFSYLVYMRKKDNKIKFSILEEQKNREGLLRNNFRTSSHVRSVFTMYDRRSDDKDGLYGK